MDVTTTHKNSTFQNTTLQDVPKMTDVPDVGPISTEKLKKSNIDIPVKLMVNFMVWICPTLPSSVSSVLYVYMVKTIWSPLFTEMSSISLKLWMMGTIVLNCGTVPQSVYDCPFLSVMDLLSCLHVPVDFRLSGVWLWYDKVYPVTLFNRWLGQETKKVYPVTRGNWWVVVKRLRKSLKHYLRRLWSCSSLELRSGMCIVEKEIFVKLFPFSKHFPDPHNHLDL